MVALLAQAATVEMMEAATRNAESPQPLPLFRPEALAARQKIQGEALFIRSFSLTFFAFLITGLTAASLGFLLLAHYQPRAAVSGSLSWVPEAFGSNAQAQMEAVFYVPERLVFNIQPGSFVQVRCQQCGSAALHTGTITHVESVAVGKRGSLPDPVIPGATYRVTVAISPFNSLPAGAARLQPGAKLEAEFPLERRRLIRWLIGAAAW